MYASLIAVSLAWTSLCSVDVEQKAPKRIAEVKIFGNTITKDSVIRDATSLFPGQALNLSGLKEAERNLNRLGVLKAVVEVENRAGEGGQPFQNILIKVTEIPANRLRIQLGANSKKELLLQLVLDERNFDPTGWPRSIDDILEGRMFRGGGQRICLTLHEINLQRGINALHLDKNGRESPKKSNR